MATNPLDESDPVRQQRIRERAYHLWEEDGCPHGRDLDYWERARELVGIEESAGAGQLPNPETHPTMKTGEPEGVEEAEIQQNLGEFPDRLADQGEWQQTPTPSAKSKRPRTRAETGTGKFGTGGSKAPSTGRRGPPKLT
jgi:hypothetical protein